MLILTRKSDESIMIGHDVIVQVVKIQGNQVHLGIKAPREVAIYRHEIYTQVMDENKKALAASSGKNTRKLKENLKGFKNLIDMSAAGPPPEAPKTNAD